MRGLVYVAAGGAGMLVGAVLVFMGVYALPHAYAEDSDGMPWWGLLVFIVVLVAIGAPLFTVSRNLARTGRRHRAPVLPDHEERRAARQRSPVRADGPRVPHDLGTRAVHDQFGDHVLYLRPFTADERLGEYSQIQSGTVALLVSRRTEEEQLALAFGSIGPVVAIGRPGEALPRVGARRLYVDDSVWQDTVAELMVSARLVVICVGAGTSAGLLWEVETACRTVPPERLVLIIAAGADEYQEIRSLVAPLVPRGLPDYPPKPRRNTLGQAPYGESAVRGAVWFDGDWAGRFVRFDTKEARYNGFSPVESAAVNCLRPVFERFPGSWPGTDVFLARRLTRRQRRKAALVLGVPLAGCLLVVLSFLL
ncbi:hypothetical protein [Streptomyces sp. NPDC046909]|uniref:hypothetical protein n=1 Tax=Streptomyces sp. NPDC046909 TaxID=3155617 RepID=UPI0033F9AE07